MDPAPDPTPFFIDFKDAKKIHIFLITCPQAHHLHYFSPLNTLMRKGKDPDPYL
jgi:hypothetical protein